MLPVEPPPVCAVAPPLGPRHTVDTSEHRQLVVAAGAARNSSYTRVTRWEYADGCWQKVAGVPARNGWHGWHPHPWDGSGYSPIGTYTLTDAGGRLRKPAGTKLPYDYSPRGFAMPAPSTHVFDYVVAVNFNRYAGRSPLDLGRPDPSIPDGGIWFHVSGAGATRGCISVARPAMRAALQWLDPAAKPVIVMGPKRVLRK